MSTQYLIHSITEIEPDGYYFGKFKSLDPICMFGPFDAPICLIHRMEMERAKKEGRFAEVLDLVEYMDKAKESHGVRSLAGAIATAAEERGITAFTVPHHYPAATYQALLDLGVGITIENGPLFPQRFIKTAEEIEQLRQGARISEAGFARVEELLRTSTVAEDGTLMLDGEVFTCELLRREIRTATTKAGGGQCSPIAASGLQAADCHCIGFGPIKAGEMIVVDIFPRDDDSYMYGDLSRTFIKGQPSEKQQHIHDTVKAAHLAAIEQFKPGAKVKDIDDAARNILKERGYETRKREDGQWEGCYCGIGHGLGLEVHEAEPRIGQHDATLEVGHVVTIEPGLYIPEYGGFRFEDTVVITADGFEFINTPCYDWIID